MKFIHIVSALVAAVIFYVGNTWLELVPMIFLQGGYGLIAVAGVFYYFNDQIGEYTDGLLSSFQDGSDDYSTEIDAMEAPHFVNQYLEEKRSEGKNIPGRKIEIDFTKEAHEDIRIYSRESPRRKHMMCGIVGRPEGQSTGRMLAYVIDLSIPEIRDYKGDVPKDERENIWNSGKWDWLFKEHFRVEDKDSYRGKGGGPPINIYRGGGNQSQGSSSQGDGS